MAVDPKKTKSRLLAAIDQAERDTVRRRSLMESRQRAREDILRELCELHDGLLRLRCAAERHERSAQVERETTALLAGLADRLKQVLVEGQGDTTDLMAGSLQPMGVQTAGGYREVRATPPPTNGSHEELARTLSAVEPAEAGPVEELHCDLEEKLKPIYQEILTLEEHQGLFEGEELRDRVILLLARMRRAQDGDLGRPMTAEQRQFMTTRFGLLESLQKRRNLGYMNELNRRYSTDWDELIAELDERTIPLAERIEQLSTERELSEARKRAAVEQSARRRLEGEEILNELRFFVRGPELQTPVGRSRFRRLVSEASSCLPPSYDALHDVIDPHLEHLEGKDFKALRKAARRFDDAPERAVPDSEPKPSKEADHEELLKGAYAGGRAVICGGQRREKAEEILRDHLGLDRVTWISAHEITVEGPGRTESLLAREDTTLAVVLVDSLNDNLTRRLRGCSRSGSLILVRGGQEVSRILSALPRPQDVSPGSRVGTVSEALGRVMDEYPDAIVTSFNSASRVKDCPFEDGAAVYKAFRFLATTYRDSRAGRKSCPDIDLELRQTCGFHYRPHQTASTMGRYEDDYVATYKGRRYELTEHLGRGVNRDPRYSIRIAFTYLPQEDRVLVGFLGQHQKTTTS